MPLFLKNLLLIKDSYRYGRNTLTFENLKPGRLNFNFESHPSNFENQYNF